MFNKSNDLIGIILTDDTLRLAQLQVSGGARKVIQIFRQGIRQLTPDERLNVLSNALQEFKVKKPHAFCVIPSQMVTTKNIEIPSLDPEEIRSIIDLQAGRHTPYSREEILIGYIKIDIFQRNYTKILLLIIKQDIIKQQMEFFEQAGVRIHKVIFGPEAIAAFYGKGLEVKEDDIPVGIINIADTTTDFTIEFNRTVATYRNVPLGMTNLIKEGIAVQEKLVEEIARSVEVYQNEDINKLPETYLLTSDDAKVKELQPRLEERLKAKVKVMPYLDLIEAPQPVMLKLVSEYNDDSFLDLVAAAAVLNDVQVDLTPDEVKIKRTIEEKGREVVKLGISVLLILVMVCALFFGKIYFRGLSLDHLKESYVEYHRKVLLLDNMAQKTRIIKSFVNNRMVPLEMIQELYELIPDEIYLENITLDENGRIMIRGISASMSRVFNFVSSLEDSQLFKAVKTTSTTAKKDRGKDAAAFEIAFRLESADDEIEVESAEEGEEAPAEE